MNSLFDTVVSIEGPTASGKSLLAEEVAKLINGEIISADSMQIYRGMDIGTAKLPSKQRCVPYHCIDILNPGDEYSAALFQRDARKAILDIQSRGHRAILCGGTGLYVRATLDDMDFAPGEHSSEVRKMYSELLDQVGAAELHRRLAERDPESAALIHPNNTRRVIRAFEMLEEGESYAARKRAFKTVSAFIPRVKFALDMDRGLLYRRIDKRVDSMVNDGLIDEVKALIDHGFRKAVTSAQAIGYKEIVSYLDGNCTLDEAVCSIKQSSRRYAKRQLTWLRSDSEIIWLHADDGITDKLITIVMDSIEKGMRS